MAPTISPLMLEKGVISSALEERLRRFFAEQERLRERLDQTRAELDVVNAELREFQYAYCTDKAREEEYLECLERILGFDRRIDEKEIEEAIKNPCGIEDIIEELQRDVNVETTRDVRWRRAHWSLPGSSFCLRARTHQSLRAQRSN
jgi:hypothetical protein